MNFNHWVPFIWYFYFYCKAAAFDKASSIHLLFYIPIEYSIFPLLIWNTCQIYLFPNFIENKVLFCYPWFFIISSRRKKVLHEHHLFQLTVSIWDLGASWIKRQFHISCYLYGIEVFKSCLDLSDLIPLFGYWLL